MGAHFYPKQPGASPVTLPWGGGLIYPPGNCKTLSFSFCALCFALLFGSRCFDLHRTCIDLRARFPKTPWLGGFWEIALAAAPLPASLLVWFGLLLVLLVMLSRSRRCSFLLCSCALALVLLCSCVLVLLCSCSCALEFCCF